ncbi:fibronectin type III domain-containing protein [Kordia sp. YSTF-M3]|uniref:Fibronectin type III domain-containing protein n=1 Tax=Kordia aestuariivivens TaxID=2759037 RepID=A0ABR7QDS3_9FLAO|nr:T9SS type A sorting domain-containing protein [Kordia aestuariivivens]MBC8756697.1 fibronectin type III domain-containing protein [Kordia aestuariivivens]
MKKITLKLFMIVFLLGTYIGVSQTLNQAASWPNANWTLSGTYTAGGLLGDPTIDATFGFDDDAAGNGSADDLQATSPVIDLTAASTAGEVWITISGDFVYRALGDVLNIEIYDADAMTWSAVQTFGNNSINTDFQTCAGTVTYTTPIINISAYTATQLSGFQYRITYDDTGGWQWGWCITSPTIVSAAPPACPDPSALTATNIDGFSADLGWTETGSASLWNVELVDITGGGVVTGTATASGVENPYMATGLTPSNNYEFYVQAQCAVSTSTWVGPFAFTTLPACPQPTALNVTNILQTTADLGWTAGGAETLWDVEIVDITGGGTATGTPTASGVANPYGASGLTDNNNYEFYVRADCTVNGTSTWTGPFAFTTLCNAFIAPYSEDFENGGALPACWTLGGDDDWEFNTAGPNHVGNGGVLSGSTPSGNFYAVVDDSVPDAANAELTSPFIDVSGLTTPALIFYEISNNEGLGRPNATLTASVWDGAAWNVVGTYNTNTIADGWEQKIVDLSGLTFTGAAQVRFSIADSGSFYDDIAIDDVSVEELPTCPDPSMLTATNITNASADLGWTESGSATLWNVELVDVTGGGTVTGTATASGVANPYMATGLAENNNYEFYVLADCGINGTSGWVGPFAFTTLETCPIPSALTVGNIMETTADFNWTENGTATSWNIELVDVTAGGTFTGTPTASGVTTIPYNQTGLVADNAYRFFVQADCGVDGTSMWAGPFRFSSQYVAVPPDCTNGIFLDSGGINGDYGFSENITYTICPDLAGDVVEVEFTAFSTENDDAATCFDGLTIHNGADATATTVDPPGGGTIWCYDNDAAEGTGDLLGQTITSTDASGCLTFVFTSDGDVQLDGWEAIVNCATLSTISFGNGRAFTYFPNPVANKLTLVAGKKIENVTIYNILGAQVATLSPNSLTKDVDTSKLTAGTYFVQVTVDGATDTIKIIKQ